MADSASAGRVAADIRPPDFRKAVQHIRHDIKKKKDRISGINGEIADIWGKIEGLKVDKTAGKMFAKLDALEPDERIAVMRSLNGLLDAAGYPETADQDLADQAEGKVVHMRAGGKGEDDGGEGGGGADEGGAEGEEEDEDEDPPAPPKAGRGRGVAGLAAARSHLGGGTASANDALSAPGTQH